MDLKLDSNKFIFRALTFFKSSNSYSLRTPNKSLSYTSVRESLLSMVASIGLERSQFGTHSLRSGGATAAANNGVNDRLFKRHGRWISEKAKDGYVKDSFDSLLSVSLSLGS